MLIDTNKSVVSDYTLDIEKRCPACFATRMRALGNKSGYALSECVACGVVFTTVRNHDNALGELYDRYYDHAQFVIPPIVAASLERFVRSCEGFRSANRWLDIGYGEGGMLEIASRFGWQCYGTEISPPAIEFGRTRGWAVATDPESDPRFTHHGFDVITMIELLEHLPAPISLLQQAARWLRPGGLCYITTPNARSLNERLLGFEWSIFSPPEHVTIWTARGLRHALTKAGFKVQRVRTEGFNPCEILARLQARNEAAQPVDRNTTAFTLNATFSSSPFRRAVKAGINRCLSAFQAGDTLKVWAVRN
jgi:SAM-dependent methyltransferase